MTELGQLVQSRKKPPVLIPLREPLSQRKDKLIARIKLIHSYAEHYRELDDIEARELLNLRHILEHGVEKPKGHWFPGMEKKKKVYDEKQIKQALSLLA